MKAKKCKMVFNSRWGHISAPMEFPSISAGLKFAKESGWFAYRVYVDGKLVRRGFCDN